MNFMIATPKSLSSFLSLSFFICFAACTYCTQEQKVIAREKTTEYTQKGDPEVKPLSPPKRSYWPTQAWRTKPPEEVGLSRAGLAKLEKYAFSTTPEERKRSKGLRTSSLLIVKDGYIVYEKYAANYTKDSVHQLWSLSKCFVNTLVGIAHNEGLLELDKAAYHYLPILNRPDKSKITVRHLLNLSSGIDWESSGKSEFLFSKYYEIFTLWGNASKNMPAAIAQKKMRAPAGSYIYYSSAEGILLSAMLREILKQRYLSFPWDSLFKIIGMRHVSIERDGAGNFILPAYIYASARDLSKLAFLYLNNGKWSGRTILNEEWIRFTRTLAPAYTQIREERQRIQRRNLTAHWYVNTGLASANVSVPWPSAPRDTFGCSGHWRQRIFVIPSLDMIIVRTASSYGDKVNWENETFFKIMNESVLIKK